MAACRTRRCITLTDYTVSGNFAVASGRIRRIGGGGLLNESLGTDRDQLSISAATPPQTAAVACTRGSTAAAAADQLHHERQHATTGGGLFSFGALSDSTATLPTRSWR